MNKEIKRKWVKALLSGKFDQAHGHLRSSGGHCCLGVVREVCGGTTPPKFALLDDEDLNRFGLTDKEQIKLADVNDCGVPFDMIAGLIHTAL